MKAPSDKAIGYTVAVVITVIVIGVVIGIVSTLFVANPLAPNLVQ
jgi:preprotein translocase subunit SecF